MNLHLSSTPEQCFSEPCAVLFHPRFLLMVKLRVTQWRASFCPARNAQNLFCSHRCNTELQETRAASNHRNNQKQQGDHHMTKMQDTSLSAYIRFKDTSSKPRRTNLRSHTKETADGKGHHNQRDQPWPWHTNIKRVRQGEKNIGQKDWLWSQGGLGWERLLELGLEGKSMTIENSPSEWQFLRRMDWGKCPIRIWETSRWSKKEFKSIQNQVAYEDGDWFQIKKYTKNGSKLFWRSRMTQIFRRSSVN